MASCESFGKIGSDDDWEEIADNYSVKSLSSDDEEDEKPAASTVPTPSKVDSSPSHSRTSPNRHAAQANVSHDANMSILGHTLSKVDIGTQAPPRATSPAYLDKMPAIKTASAPKPKNMLPPSEQDIRRSTSSSPKKEAQQPQDLPKYPHRYTLGEGSSRYTKEPPETTDNGTLSKKEENLSIRMAAGSVTRTNGPFPSPPDFMSPQYDRACPHPNSPRRPLPVSRRSATHRKGSEGPGTLQSGGLKTLGVNGLTDSSLPYRDAAIQESSSWEQLMVRKTMAERVSYAPLEIKSPPESNDTAARNSSCLEAHDLVFEQEPTREEIVSKCGASFGASTHDTAQQSLGDTLDLDENSTDPVVINNALQSLSRMLRDTSPALCIMHLKHAPKVLPACKCLLAQVDSLMPILAVYATKYNQPTATARDVPLDPTLMMWIASLSRTLWEIGFEFKIVESNNPGTINPKRAPSLETLIGELESAAQQMEEFLPIIQADFNEFQKKQKPLFPASTAAPESTPEMVTPNDYQRPHIRQTMYGLKKEVQHAISILKSCQKWLPDPSKVIVGDVTNSLTILFDMVSDVMASNGPAWIEDRGSETARERLLTHSDFGTLDPTMIEDLSARIQQICDLVHIDGAESRTWSEEMIREHHVCMLIEQQQIDSLEHTVSVLTKMLLR